MAVCVVCTALRLYDYVCVSLCWSCFCDSLALCLSYLIILFSSLALAPLAIGHWRLGTDWGVILYFEYIAIYHLVILLILIIVCLLLVYCTYWGVLLVESIRFIGILDSSDFAKHLVHCNIEKNDAPTATRHMKVEKRTTSCMGG